MPSTRHNLIVTGRRMRQPVFIIGAPHSGTHVLAQALKRSDGVHLTIGQAAVLRVIYAFARRPSIHNGRGEAAGSVLRDVVANMLRDQAILSWFKPSFANLDTEFPNPFFGVETEEDRDSWPDLSLAGKSAMRWRGAVGRAAGLPRSLPAEQLITIRYETLLERPEATAAAISSFIEVP